MSKNKFQILIIIGLLLSNIVIGFLAFREGSSKKKIPAKPKEVIIAKLSFDKNQIQSYEMLITEHQLQIHQLDDSLRYYKKTLYQLLKADATDNHKIDSISNKMGLLQKKIETIHYHHFEDIKALCKAKQIPAFWELTDELNQIFDRRPPHHKR